MEIQGNWEGVVDFVKILKDLYETKKGFLLLAGNNGTGKSMAAKMVYNLCNPFTLSHPGAKCDDEAIFITQSDLKGTVNKNLKDFGETFSYLQEIRKTKLFVLDDLGVSCPTDSFIDFLFSLIDYRSSNNLGTIITTNLTSKEVRELYGDRFLSRIGSGKVFRFTGKDRRKVLF